MDASYALTNIFLTQILFSAIPLYIFFDPNSVPPALPCTINVCVIQLLPHLSLSLPVIKLGLFTCIS